MSQVSSWLGPPTSINRMQLTSREVCTAPAALRTSRISQRQAQERERSRVQEIAPAQPIAEVNALFRVESEHDASRADARRRARGRRE